MEKKISLLQKQIIETDKNKVVVLSAAGSGKTLCITERLRYLLRQGVPPTDIVAITFTNNAADTMISRLGDDFKKGLFIGTIHSLANYFLLSSGINTEKLLEQEKFDKLFAEIRKNPHCVKRYKYLLLDEAQDSDELQFEFIFDGINPDNFFIVGDPRQSIYQWKGSDPSLLLDLSKQYGVTTYNLNENYRNGSNILNYARRIIRGAGLNDDSVAVSKYLGNVKDVELDESNLAKSLKNVGDTNYGSWAVLTRTNAEIERFIYFLEKNGVPYDTFKQAQLSNEELNKKMNDNTVKVLTIHSAKGLEWENVIVIGARFFPIEERYVSYVAATRAKSNLIWTNKIKKTKKKETFKWE